MELGLNSMHKNKKKGNSYFGANKQIAWNIERVLKENGEGNYEYDCAWDVVPKQQMKVGVLSESLLSALGMQSIKDPPPYFRNLVKEGVPPLCKWKFFEGFKMR